MSIKLKPISDELKLNRIKYENPWWVSNDPSGYNYPLLDILDTQIDTLLHEAEEYRSRKKHGAGVQQTMSLPAAEKMAETNKQHVDVLDAVIANKKQPKAKMAIASA